MKKSKFVGKTFDNGWVCTGCNLRANYSHCTRHNKYWYAFTRPTADNKFNKWIRVEAKEATKIWKGELTVEEVCQKQEAKHTHRHSINYLFK